MMPLSGALHLLSFCLTTMLAIVLLPGTLELLVVSLGCVLPRWKKVPLQRSCEPESCAVVVPAHNESLLISRCIASLSHAAANAGRPVQIVVVADNCCDDTAQKAKAAGARVLTRSDREVLGKGQALRYAFDSLKAENLTAIFVVDADSEVSANYFSACGSFFDKGYSAVQVPYLARNGSASRRTQLLDIALLAFNQVRPLGRSKLGLSCGIFGNGFGVSSRCLEQIPYQAFSIVEDLEFHLRLVIGGVEVKFVPEASVRADMPLGSGAAGTQRARWEGGRLAVALEYLPNLAGSVLCGHWRSFEPMLDLLCLPLAYHGGLLLLLGGICSASSMPVVISAFTVAAICILGLHVALAISFSDNPRRACAALLTTPLYLVWKLSIMPKILGSASRRAKWTRTEREA